MVKRKSLSLGGQYCSPGQPNVMYLPYPEVHINDLTLFYIGFGDTLSHGGDQNDPLLLKSIKMIQTW